MGREQIQARSRTCRIGPCSDVTSKSSSVKSPNRRPPPDSRSGAQPTRTHASAVSRPVRNVSPVVYDVTHEAPGAAVRSSSPRGISGRVVKSVVVVTSDLSGGTPVTKVSLSDAGPRTRWRRAATVPAALRPRPAGARGARTR